MFTEQEMLCTTFPPVFKAFLQALWGQLGSALLRDHRREQEHGQGMG